MKRMNAERKKHAWKEIAWNKIKVITWGSKSIIHSICILSKRWWSFSSLKHCMNMNGISVFWNKDIKSSSINTSLHHHYQKNRIMHDGKYCELKELKWFHFFFAKHFVHVTVFVLLIIQVICMPMYVIQTNSLYLQQKGNLHQTLNNKVNHNQKVIHIDLIYFYIEYIVDLFPCFILFSQYFPFFFLIMNISLLS